ncbi:MAG TPA: hypothetical protein VKE94_20975 [Gemmataceae bacterium]|nr:hypothetical protein [Gemmataceae bacterium]
MNRTRAQRRQRQAAGTTPAPVAWTPFVDVTHTISSPLTKQLGFTLEETVYALTQSCEGRVFQNNLYRVIRRPFTTPMGDGRQTCYELSIKRTDKDAIHDWRHLQRIKNELVGPEYEAVEIYPAESRLVDTSNQYYLWVLPEGYHVPFGFQERSLIEQNLDGSRQRPFPPDARPPDLRRPTRQDGIAHLQKLRERFHEENRGGNQEDVQESPEPAGVCGPGSVECAGPGPAEVPVDGGSDVPVQEHHTGAQACPHQGPGGPVHQPAAPPLPEDRGPLSPPEPEAGGAGQNPAT